MAPLTLSKLAAPSVPRSLLVTDRLRALSTDPVRAVEIVAPAGYGKTTAIAAALSGKRSVHWYRLDSEDRWLPIFYAHLLHSLFGQHRPRLQPEAEGYLRSVANLDSDYPLVNAVLCQDVWQAYGGSRAGVRYLVFDDFHYVADCQPLVETLRYLAVNLPPSFRLIVASRVPTGVFDGSLGLSGAVRRISLRELSFTAAETATYALEVRHLALPAEVLRQVHSRTEGWISGVVMACNALEQAGPAADMPAVFDPEAVFRYFLTEVLSKPQPSLVRQLATVATLDEFTAADIRAAFGIAEAEELLATCVSGNLFLQQVGVPPSSYRFHSLFRAALLKARDVQFSRGEVVQLESAAASYYLGRGDVLKAVRHLIRAGDFGQSVRLLSEHGLRLLYGGAGENLLALLEQLPQQVVHDSPYLSFYAGFAVLNRDFVLSRAHLANAARGFAALGAVDLQVQVVAVLFTAYAQRNDVAMMNELVGELQQLAGRVKTEAVRGVLLACRLGSAAFGERFPEALELEQQLQPIELDEVWRHAVNNFLSMVYYRRGDLASGRRFIERNQSLGVVRNNDQWRILNLVICHTISLYQNDRAWSAWIRSQLLSLGDQYGSSYALGFGKKDAAVDRYNSHDVPGALELMQSSAEHFRRLNNLAQVHRSILYRNLWLTEYDPAQVRLDEVMQAYDYLAPDRAGQGFAETAQSFTGIILRELGQYQRASELLNAAYATSTAKGALQSMAGIAMHLAKLHYDLNAGETALDHLRTFIHLAAEHGFVYFYDLHFPTLVEMAARCVAEDVRPAYALALISRYFGAEAAHYLETHAARMCSPAEARTFALSRGRPSGSGRVVEVRLLGDFSIRAGDDRVAETEWRTRKAQRILRYLILRRNQYVPKEMLAGLFWPDTERRAAMASINVAMYELRRVLAAHGMAAEDETPLVSERLDGYEVRTSDRLVVDVDVLEQLADRSRALTARGRDARPLLRELIELYRGDLLPQDLYEDWADLERQRLRGLYLDAVVQLATLEVADRRYHEVEPVLVRALQLDPYSEQLCCLLLEVYDRTGQAQARSHLHDTFVERYRRDLGSRPKLDGRKAGI